LFITYKIYCTLENVDKVYIGYTRNGEKRWAEHKNAAERGIDYYLYRCMRSYGVSNFAFEILETYTAMSDALAAEIRLIAEHKSNKVIHKNGPGMNMTSGGQGISRKDIPVTETTREKMRRAKLGKPSNRKDYTVSEETRLKQSLARIGKVIPRDIVEKTASKLRKAIIVTSADGTETEYDCARSAAEAIGSDFSSITKCCNGQYKSTKGYTVRYKDPCHIPAKAKGLVMTDEQKKNMFGHGLTRIIVCNSGIETEYESIKAAAMALGLKPSRVSNILGGRRKPVNGYVFKYADSNIKTSNQGEK